MPSAEYGSAIGAGWSDDGGTGLKKPQARPDITGLCRRESSAITGQHGLGPLVSENI
jgi:hypothetical protein